MQPDTVGLPLKECEHPEMQRKGERTVGGQTSFRKVLTSSCSPDREPTGIVSITIDKVPLYTLS